MAPPSSPRRRRPPFIIDRNTLRLLLIPEPLVVLTYLVGTHARVIQPSVAPLLIIAALPFAAAIVAMRGLSTLHYSRPRNWAVLGISLVELVSAALALATLAALTRPHVERSRPLSAPAAFARDGIGGNLPGISLDSTASR